MRMNYLVRAASLIALFGLLVFPTYACQVCVIGGVCADSTHGFALCESHPEGGYCLGAGPGCEYAYTPPYNPPGSGGDWTYLDDNMTPDQPTNPNNYSAPANPGQTSPGWLSSAGMNVYGMPRFLEKSGTNGCSAAATASRFALDVPAATLYSIFDAAPRHAEMLLVTSVTSKATGHFVGEGLINANATPPSDAEVRAAIAQQRIPKPAPVTGAEVSFLTQVHSTGTPDFLLDITSKSDGKSLVLWLTPVSQNQSLDDGASVPVYRVKAWKLVLKEAASPEHATGTPNV